MRPVAWAATIGISLAFMLELTWFADTPTGAPVPAPAVSEERARQDAEVMKAKQEGSLNQAIAERVDEQAEAPPATEGASLLRAAERQARSRAASLQTDADRTDAAGMDEERACGDEVRDTAERWYDCIRELREQGRDADAAFELDALLRAFPEFREPPPE